MGYEAVKLLNRLLSSQKVPQQPILVPPQRVITRRSTDYRSLTDPMVVKAIHFIRGNACKGIKVENVLDLLQASRLNLEKKFIAELGMTIHKVLWIAPRTVDIPGL